MSDQLLSWIAQTVLTAYKYGEMRTRCVWIRKRKDVVESQLQWRRVRQRLCHLKFVHVRDLFATATIDANYLFPLPFFRPLVWYTISLMGYIPQHALGNLRKYSYKGVDKYVLQKPLALSRVVDQANLPGHSFPTMCWTHSGTGSWPYGPPQSHQTRWISALYIECRPLIYLGAVDHGIRTVDCGCKFCDNVVLRPPLSDREGWSSWPTTMDLFYVSPCS